MSAQPTKADLENPDFITYAEAFGLTAFRVTKTQNFAAAFESAVSKPGPSLIELVVSEETYRLHSL